jgi:probable biosynthetic protein (TIGR04098 family)
VRALPARSCALPMAEPDLMALDARARDTSRALRGRTVPLAGAQRIEPCHGLDFNAVGLLYFPSFTRLIETAARSTAPIRVRELVYLGNLDAGAAVHVLRAGRETLVARDDGSLIARAVEARASASRPDQPDPA